MKSETRGTFPIPAIIIHHNDIVAKKQLQSIIHYMVLEWSKLKALQRTVYSERKQQAFTSLHRKLRILGFSEREGIRFTSFP